MTTAFTGRARVAGGSVPTPTTQPYDVIVDAGRLRLVAADSSGVVLDVPLDGLRARPLGRAGAVVVEVEGSPLLVDLSHRAHGGGVGRAVRRAVHGVRGWLVRRRFLSATARRPR